MFTNVENNKSTVTLLCYLLLFLVTAIVCLPKVFVLDTSGIDGIIYSSRATYAAFNNDWFIQGETTPSAYFDHPPTLIWFNALVFKILGTHEFNSKIIIMVFGLLCVLPVFHFTKTIGNYETGLFAALFFLLLPRVALHMTRFMFDIPLVFFVSLAFFALYQLTVQRSSKYFLLFWIALGFAVLMKGIVGLGPLLACVVLVSLKKIDWKSKYFFIGFFLCVAIIMSLDVVYYVNLKSSFWKQYWHYQVSRALSGANESNYQHFPIYFQELFTRWLFGTVFLFIFPWKVKARKELYFFILLWIACFVIPLSFAKKNAALYLLPVNPALALCAGVVIHEVWKTNFYKKLAFILFILLGCALFFFPQQRLKRQWVGMKNEVLLGNWLRHASEPVKRVGFLNPELDKRWLEYYAAALERGDSIERFSTLTTESSHIDYYLVSEGEYNKNKNFFDVNGYLMSDQYSLPAPSSLHYFLLKR